MSTGKPDREPKRWSNLLGLATRKKPPIGATAADVVHRENKWRLLRYRPTHGIRANKPVLLVPSLINRHYVLDLMPGKSFVEYLLANGFDTYCIDWGTPGDEDRYLDFDEIVDRYLGRALRVTAKTSAADSAHVLGYCMGGLMAAIHASVYSSRFASLVAVAAPVKFDDDGLLSAWSRTPTMEPEALVKGLGNVPWQLMQGSFQLLRPTLNLSKTVHMIDRAWDDEYLDGFLALDTWGNDNVSFPGETWRRYIDELYRGNRFVQGTFALSGKPAQMSSITTPTMAVTFEHDNIVPWQSAKVLVDACGAARKEWLHLPGGHVGAMVSRAASKTVWPKIAAWFAVNDAGNDDKNRPARSDRDAGTAADTLGA